MTGQITGGSVNGGRELAVVEQKNPLLGRLLRRLIDGINQTTTNVKTQTTGAPAQVLATPPSSSGTATLTPLTAAYLPVATLSTVGAVKPDGTSITVNGTGTISTLEAGGITELTGDVTAGPGSGSQAASVVKVTGAAVPVSESVLGSNASGQLIAGTAFANPMTTEGDIIIGGSGGTPERLAAGTSGYVLTSNGAGTAPSYQASAGGGASPLYGIGGFGNNSLGTLVSTFSQTGTITWGPLNPLTIDATNLVTCAAGHIYRIVWYITGASSGANLALVQAGTSGSTSKGYFFAHSNVYYVNGSGYSSIGTAVSSGNLLEDLYPQIVETYLWVQAASKNKLWGRCFEGEWYSGTDTNADFTANQLEIGIVASAFKNIYVYDLGAMPTG